MKVLVDTSVWVDHFRRSNEHLKMLLMQDQVLCHPYIIGEIACGTPPAPRERTLDDLKQLDHVKSATFSEVMVFIEANNLYGKGCGFVDLSLLAATVLTPGSSLWTLDKRLNQMALELQIQHAMT